MNVLNTSMEKLNTIDTLFGEILHDEQGNTFSMLGGANDDTEESILRYTIFQMTLGDVIQPLRAAIRMAKMTDEEVRKMCESENMTVHTALENAKMNMVMDLLHKMH